MRFAFKTTPQHTTWADMLALWQAGDDIDVLESGWTSRSSICHCPTDQRSWTSWRESYARRTDDSQCGASWQRLSHEAFESNERRWR